MKISINTRYLGIVLMILSIVLVVIMFNFSQTMLELIDSGQLGSCQEYEMCPHVTVLNQTYIGYFLAFVIFVIGLFLFVYGGKPVKPEGKEKKWGDTLKTLTGDEKDVYEKVIAVGGVMFQSEIVEQTEFPKAKVSRILDKMEARGLLEKRRRGMTNAIVLK